MLMVMTQNTQPFAKATACSAALGQSNHPHAGGCMSTTEAASWGLSQLKEEGNNKQILQGKIVLFIMPMLLLR